MSDPEDAVTLTEGVKNVDNVAQVDATPDPVLSNTQRKKLETAALKAISVEKLIKKVTVDRGKEPQEWADEYEAR